MFACCEERCSYRFEVDTTNLIDSKLYVDTGYVGFGCLKLANDDFGLQLFLQCKWFVTSSIDFFTEQSEVLF